VVNNIEKSDTIITWYGEQRVKSQEPKYLWQFGYYETYWDYATSQETWFTYDKNKNRLKKSSDSERKNYRIIKMDSTAYHLGYECQLYNALPADTTTMIGMSTSKSYVLYVSNLRLELSSDRSIIPPLFSVNGHITLKSETFIYLNGEVIWKNTNKAIEVIRMEIDDESLLPPKDAKRIQ
jgi:hypothetical protein